MVVKWFIMIKRKSALWHKSMQLSVRSHEQIVCRGTSKKTGKSLSATFVICDGQVIYTQKIQIDGAARLRSKRRSPMGKYILKRILYIILVFFILSFMIYMIYNMLPVDKAAEAARADIQANRNLNYEERYEYCGGLIL